MSRIVSARRSRLLLVFGVTALASLTACGDGDGDSDDGAATTDGGDSATTPEATEGDGSAAGSETTAPGTAGVGAATDMEAYVEAGAAEIGTDDEDAATCLSRAVIDALGAEQVLATGLTPQEFFDSASLEEAGITVTDEIRADVQANAAACGDLVEIIAATIEDETQAECLRQTFTTELLAERLAVAVVGATPSPELEEAQALLQACGSG
ncbi:MAG: hypothetical protein H0W46_09300 [Acidimicrobiia bacterium]|nr:hypothetical protein [Acidimicrobiia bacterium]